MTSTTITTLYLALLLTPWVARHFLRCGQTTIAASLVGTQVAAYAILFGGFAVDPAVAQVIAKGGAGRDLGILTSLAFLWSVVLTAWLVLRLVGRLLMIGMAMIPGVFGRKTRQLVTSANTTVNVIASAYPASTPRITLKNVHGMSEMKARLLSHCADIHKEGKNGLLLSGDPGNGKTFIAEALAGEMQMNFLPIRISEVASRWVNQTTEQIQMAFAAARAQAPCVLFLDEADSLLVNRATISDADLQAKQNVNALLTLLVDVHNFKDSGVIVMAATNHKDQLDPAAIREGRFDFKEVIPNPDFEARVGLLKDRIAPGIVIDAPAVNRAARRWEGFSVVRMRAIGDRASRIARDNAHPVDFDVLRTALRDVQGTQHNPLPENTPGLQQLNFTPEMNDHLYGLANRLIDIERIESLGGSVPKGVLFHGPAGTGKTAVAKALAISSGWNLIATTGQRLANGQESLAEIIRRASDLRPAIVFIDEADDILQERSTNWRKDATNEVLALLDGTTVLQDVLFIAATNHPETLDAAAVRGGRFSEHIEFSLPDEDTVADIVAAFMAEKSMAPWSAEFTPACAAALLTGFAPADVRDRLQKAINRTISGNRHTVTLAELEAVL
jgi:transitional endoplasmic reticulum ATPase